MPLEIPSVGRAILMAGREILGVDHKFLSCKLDTRIMRTSIRISLTISATGEEALSEETVEEQKLD